MKEQTSDNVINNLNIAEKIEAINKLREQLCFINKDMHKYYNSFHIEMFKSALTYKKIKQIKEIINKFGTETLQEFKESINGVLDTEE